MENQDLQDTLIVVAFSSQFEMAEWNPAVDLVTVRGGIQGETFLGSKEWTEPGIYTEIYSSIIVIITYPNDQQIFKPKYIKIELN